MARPVTLFTGQWADLPLELLAGKLEEWGFDGVELACWGDHFEVDRAIAEPHYAKAQRDLLERHGLGCWAIGAHLVGQCVADPIDARHKGILPPEIWGDGDPEGVRRRAAERMKDTARAAAAFGVPVVNGFTGSPVWHMLYSFPPNDFDAIERGYEEFAERWGPIIDVFDAEGVKFALEVHPTEIAYDFVTTRKTLAAIGNRPGFGINLDPAISHTSSSTRPHSRSSSPTGSTTSTSRTRAAPSTGRARSSAVISTSASRSGDGTSSRPATATSTSRRSSGPSIASATRGRSRSSGRTPAWTVSGALRTLSHSYAAPTSRRQTSPSTRRCSGKAEPHW